MLLQAYLKKRKNKMKNKLLSNYSLHEWNQNGISIKEEMIKYDCEYREKHPCKCEPRCFAANNFVNGIQETHCKKMIKARTQKFRKKINAFLSLHPLIKFV